MIILNALAACLIIVPAQAVAVPSDNEAPLPGYVVEDVKWSLEVFPGQGVQNFTGTVEEVHQQIKRLNPRWEAPLPPPSRRADDEGDNEVDDFNDYDNDNSTETGLDKRLVVSKPLLRKAVLNTRCNRPPFNWAPAQTGKILDGIRYLFGITSGYQPQNNPKACGRISCSYKSAIWWCNDDPKNVKRIPNWDPIILGAFTVLNQCSSKGKVAGQCYVENDWVVVIRDAGC